MSFYNGVIVFSLRRESERVLFEISLLVHLLDSIIDSKYSLVRRLMYLAIVPDTYPLFASCQENTRTSIW